MTQTHDKSRAQLPPKAPDARKLEVRRETLKDLTPEPGNAGTIKGGVPNQTKIAVPIQTKGA